MNSKPIAALAGLGLYLAVITLPPLPDRLILFPSTGRIDVGSATRRSVPFEGGELEIWCAASRLARAQQPEFYILRFYGNADRAERWVADEAEMWNGRAVEVWGMNYPGFGGSTGPPRLATLGPAALTAFDALKQVAGDRPIVVFGAILGTTTALHVAAHRPVAGLILHNPPAIRQMILGQFGWWNLWLLAAPFAQKIPASLDSVANAGMIDAPAVFFLAENDEVVAPKYQSLVVKAYAGESAFSRFLARATTPRLVIVRSANSRGRLTGCSASSGDKRGRASRRALAPESRQGRRGAISGIARCAIPYYQEP